MLALVADLEKVDSGQLVEEAVTDFTSFVLLAGKRSSMSVSPSVRR